MHLDAGKPRKGSAIVASKSEGPKNDVALANRLQQLDYGSLHLHFYTQTAIIVHRCKFRTQAFVDRFSEEIKIKMWDYPEKLKALDTQRYEGSTTFKPLDSFLRPMNKCKPL